MEPFKQALIWSHCHYYVMKGSHVSPNTSILMRSDFKGALEWHSIAVLFLYIRLVSVAKWMCLVKSRINSLSEYPSETFPCCFVPWQFKQDYCKEGGYEFLRWFSLFTLHYSSCGFTFLSRIHCFLLFLPFLPLPSCLPSIIHQIFILTSIIHQVFCCML